MELSFQIKNFTITILKKFFSDTPNLRKLSEDRTLKPKASLPPFLPKLKQKNFLMKLNMISCIILALVLLVYMVLLRCTNSPLVIHFLIFVQLSRLQVLLAITLPVFFMIFSHLQFQIITLPKILFLLFPKLIMQIFPKNFFFPAK